MTHRTLSGTGTVLVAFIFLLSIALHTAAATPRARDLGIPFDGNPGELNAITDVAGVTVGHTTIIEGEGKLEIGKGPVRTGVTAIFPLGRESMDGVAAGLFSLNGTGELTGSHLIREMGLFLGPVMLTNSWSVGDVHSAVLQWTRKTLPEPVWFTRTLPVVAETADLPLNDMFGQHVKAEHVFAALNSAANGPVAEGNVGGGTGMVAFGHKGGIGTASRVVEQWGTSYTVGVLAQANFGSKSQLAIAGVPVGKHLTQGKDLPDRGNSLILIIATDAPLAPGQLDRLARRAALGVGRVGGTARSLSGEIFLAFSTTNVQSVMGTAPVPTLPNLETDMMDALFAATVQATEEALINQLVASETMTGAGDMTIHALPHGQVVELLKQHGRIR